MNTTIKILAKELNLSVATVSKALRDSHEISNETKEKVQALAKKLNYVPNPYASSLRKRRSHTIAVVLPEVADSFFSLAINGIESIAQDNGYHVLIYLTHERFVREEAILNEFKGGRVDGILISVSGETSVGDHIRNVIAAGVPVVFFDRICDDVETAKVITDDFDSGYKATCHLAERGCKKIAYLSGPSVLSISNSRMNGFKKAIVDLGFKTGQSTILTCGNDIDDNYQAILGMLRQQERPDGVIACIEKFTASIYLACTELRLSIPGDLKVISFTNLPTAPLLNPPLTTITQPAFEMGKAAASVLFKVLQKNETVVKDETMIIPSALTIRHSTSDS